MAFSVAERFLCFKFLFSAGGHQTSGHAGQQRFEEMFLDVHTDKESYGVC